MDREKQSEHPLAQAIVEGVKERNIVFHEVSDFEAIPGFGIKAIVDEKEILVGTRRLMQQYDIDVKHILEKMTAFENQGKTAMLVAVDGAYAGIIAVADTIKDASSQAIKRLREMDLDVIMITGDNERTAFAIAKEAGIDHVIAEVFQKEKQRK